MAVKVSSPFLVCLTLLLFTSVRGEGFLSTEEIQRNAVLLSHYTSHDSQWELFPYVSISCDCSITSWTFIATEQPGNSNGQSIQFQLWTPAGNSNNSIFSLVKSVDVEIERVERLSPANSLGVSLLRLTMDPPVEVTGNTLFGVFQPLTARSDLILQYQFGRAPDSFQRPVTQPSNEFKTAETITNNDYPLVAIEHSCSDKCINGFLRVEGVEKFSAGNSNISLVNYRGRERLLPSLNFTCNTTITSISVGAKRVFGGGTPEIRIYRPMGPRRFREVQRILLARMTTPEDPGVYKFTVTDSYLVVKGDIVSVFETNNSSLGLYNERDAGIYPLSIDGRNTINPEKDDDWPLLSIETDDDGCTAGFMTPSDLVKKSLSLAFSTDLKLNFACVVPDIQFPRDGLLSKLVFVGQFLQSSPPDNTLYPELQIWRLQEGNSNNDIYVKLNTTGTSTAPHFTGHLNVYEYNFDPPVEVKEGYVLGYHQPLFTRSRLGLVSIQDKGPENYCIFGQNPDNLSIQSNAVAPFIRTPLISFEYVGDDPSTTPTDDSSDSGSAVGAVVGGVVVALVIGAVLVGVAILLVVLWLRRRGREKPKVTQELDDIQNPTYGEGYNAVYAIPSDLQPSPIPHPPPFSPYEEPDRSIPGSKAGTLEHGYHTLEPTGVVKVPLPSAGGINTHSVSPNGIETPPELIYHTPTEPQSSVGWGIYVPTEEQRASFHETQSAKHYEHFYAELSKYANVNGDHGPTFFEEETMYWKPASDARNLYKQLSSKKYRELPRHQISHRNEHLGSGQFGTVSQGVWSSPKGPVNVAVKTLKPGCSEGDKIKFLQEAAINGQFKHPNIVKLIGVVTIGQPVMIVLELMSNGDLRNFLLEMRSNPSQSFPANLSQMLLRFCQDIASGMQYLAGKSFVHRDLAARNILVSENYTCKISDFGMSRDLEDEAYYVSSGGKIPIKWTAPEAIHYKKYSTASDVWSFGMVMYEIWSLGHKPFEEYTNTECVKMLEKGYTLPPPPGCTREIYRIMTLCWDPTKSSRPSFTTLCSLLSEPPSQILYWSTQDASSISPEAVVLGGTLKDGSSLYPDLQKNYLST